MLPWLLIEKNFNIEQHIMTIGYVYQQPLNLNTMAIIINIDVLLAKRKMSVADLSKRIGIGITAISKLKNNRAKSIRLSVLEAICRNLDCQPGDILENGSEPHKTYT